MSEALSMSKSPSSLIRRLSRGAQSRISRRRNSNTSTSHDQSAGPVIMRGRSNSNKLRNDSTLDVSDFELEPHDEVADHPYSASLPTPDLQARSSLAASRDGWAPALPSTLNIGSWITKVTKKRGKRVFLQLDFDSGKVFWDPNKSSKQFYIDDVQYIRVGSDAREYREAAQFSADCEDKWFTVIFLTPDTSKGRGALRSLHFIADEPEALQSWVDGINQIQQLRIQTMADMAKGGENCLQQLWHRETGAMDDEARLAFPAVYSLCKTLSINCSESSLRTHFHQADYAHVGSIDFDQFRCFIKRLRKRQDIKQVFKNIKPSSMKELDQQSFLDFLVNIQGISVNSRLSHWTSTFERFCNRFRKDGEARTNQTTMNFAAFQDLMMHSAISGATNGRTSDRPLDRPLNEYFISSSHNTYLTGRQFMDDCSTEAYVSALTRGCRCVEIDCWDGPGGPGGRPEVRHGRNFTKPVLFSDCIHVINEHAFRSSAYPLIISLEVHCSPPQQAAMVDTMTSIFGDKLVTTPIDDSSVLPSPEQLKGRILIKVKASAEELGEIAQSMEGSASSSRHTNSPRAVSLSLDTQLPSSLTLPSPVCMTPIDADTTPREGRHSSSATPLSLSSSAEESDFISEKRRKMPSSNIVRVLGDLGVYAKGIKYTSFKTSQAKTFNHIYSFAEGTFERIAMKAADSESMEKHNKRHLMRVYPSNFRVQSDNFDPLKFWRRGVQMSALNWQTHDHGMQINDAMFAAGDDQAGYVLKPLDMRVDINERNPRPLKRLVRFSIDVISAQQLPRPRNWAGDGINPFVQLEVFTPEDRSKAGAEAVAGAGSLRRRTHIVENNGYDPTFHDTLSVAVETCYPSLVFVRLTVHNSLDGRTPHTSGPAPLATFTAKLDSLQQGYRHIPLNNAANERYYFATLFCRVNKLPVELAPDGSETFETASATVSEAGSGSHRTGIFKRVFGRSSSLRKKEAAGGTPLTLGSPAHSSVRRVASEDSGLQSSQ
jgi:phosphatidylinositol phospholipase C delta